MRARLILFIFVLSILSCGKKAPPKLPHYESPPAPKSLSAIHREDKIYLNWTYPGKIHLLEGFNVFRSDEEGSFKKIASVKETSYSEVVEPKRHYKYRVSARSIEGIEGKPSEPIEIYTKEVPPPPIGVSFSIGSEYITIRWGHIENGVLFNIYKGTEGGDYGLSPINNAPIYETEFNDLIDTNSPVYYIIRALRGGELRDESLPSSVIVIRPEDFVPSPPTNLRVIKVEGASVIEWAENPERWVMGYRIYKIKNGEMSLAGESPTPAFSDISPPEGVSYRVSAIGPVKEGALSLEAIPK